LRIHASDFFLNLLGSAILAFGLCHIHSFAGVTEGGVLGATLLLQYWFTISPAWSGLIMNALCYLLGACILGKRFVASSLTAGLGFSLFYALAECFPPFWPGLSEHPVLAALAGALFVGIGVGLCIRAGGAPTGDDALAMSLCHLFGWKLPRIYLITDLIVLLLSASYIPAEPLACSLFSVVLSGQVIGWMQKYPGFTKKNRKNGFLKERT